MKKLWCVAGRKDADLTSLYSVQCLHVVPLPAKLWRLRHWTGSLLPPSFLTSCELQWTAVEEETKEGGRERAATPGSATLTKWCAVVQMEDCEEGVEDGWWWVRVPFCRFTSSFVASSRPSLTILKSIATSGDGQGSVEEVHCEGGGSIVEWLWQHISKHHIVALVCTFSDWCYDRNLEWRSQECTAICCSDALIYICWKQTVPKHLLSKMYYVLKYFKFYLWANKAS